MPAPALSTNDHGRSLTRKRKVSATESTGSIKRRGTSSLAKLRGIPGSKETSGNGNARSVDKGKARAPSDNASASEDDSDEDRAAQLAQLNALGQAFMSSFVQPKDATAGTAKAGGGMRDRKRARQAAEAAAASANQNELQEQGGESVLGAVGDELEMLLAEQEEDDDDEDDGEEDEEEEEAGASSDSAFEHSDVSDVELDYHEQASAGPSRASTSKAPAGASDSTITSANVVSTSRRVPETIVFNGGGLTSSRDSAIAVGGGKQGWKAFMVSVPIVRKSHVLGI